MGQSLSEPITDKNTASCENSTFKVGSSSMQGWREEMEDSHTHILSLPGDPDTAFFAVYDGHIGSNAAEYAGKHLHKILINREEYKKGDIEEGLKQAFLETDTFIYDQSPQSDRSGTTAVAIIVRGNLLYCANVGDSRAVASIAGRATPLSVDHKPENADEYARIIAAGGEIMDGRVNGNLALTRALGDFMYKRNDKKPPEEQIITAYPDVQVHEITADWEFVVVACDGIWDVMSNEEVVAYVRGRIASGMQPQKICETLMMTCLAPDCAYVGSDNMTVVIIGLLQGDSYNDLREKCGRACIAEDHEEEILE